MEEAPRNKLEEASRRGQQGNLDRGGGQQTDGSKRAGGRRIVGTGKRTGIWITPGRCEVVWGGVVWIKVGGRGKGGSGHRGRFRRRQKRAGGAGLGKKSI